MPYRIPTLASLLLRENREIYVIRFTRSNPLDPDNVIVHPAGFDRLWDWISKSIPGTFCEFLDCSGTHIFSESKTEALLWIDFTADGLRKFRDAWEDSEGNSLDPCFDLCEVSLCNIDRINFLASRSLPMRWSTNPRDHEISEPEWKRIFSKKDGSLENLTPFRVAAPSIEQVDRLNAPQSA